MTEPQPTHVEHPDNQPIIKNIEFQQDGQQLAGLLYEAPGVNNPGLVILRGGANIPNSESDNPVWQQAMADQGINSLSFDFRGTGDSEGVLAETSLKTRADDARAAIETLKQQSSSGDIYLAGVSMGAPVVVKIAAEVGAKGVVLISPAAYSAEAEDKNFGSAFSEAIRKERSWEGSPDFDALKAFHGEMLLAYAKGDHIIPEEVLHTYAEIVADNGGKTLAFNATHSFLRLEDQPSLEARKELYDSIVELMKP